MVGLLLGHCWSLVLVFVSILVLFIPIVGLLLVVCCFIVGLLVAYCWSIVNLLFSLLLVCIVLNHCWSSVSFFLVHWLSIVSLPLG